jgi:DNA mismatch repair protein MutL
MPPIRQLDPSLVNKIAAGEVIERPASVVKEMLENALDAGATRIDIALEEGGTGLIRVSDNGRGIPGEELPLAVAPHATSKIATADDLFRISSLGFRGEALASIAAVSRFRIASRTAEQLEAYELTPEDGPSRPRACAGPVGTTVEARNLFYNVPARRKFLRQAPTELANVTEQLARLALGHPGVAFTLSHNGRPMRQLPPTGGRRARIGDFYGAELAACLLELDRQERGVRIEALIAPPAESRTSSKWQYLFLNGRYIIDRRIGFAIREAFRGLVEHDRYPVVFLFLTAPADAFDVNVHPTKIEVRWRDSGLVQSQVLAALRETLLGHDLTPPLTLQRQGAGIGGRFAAQQDPSREGRTRQALADFLRSINPTQARLDFGGPRATPAGPPPLIGPPANAGPGAERGPAVPAAGSGAEVAGLGAPESAAAHRAGSPPAGEAVAGGLLQVHNTYIVAQTTEGMVIIDQHALHERILYERFRERLLAGPLESQRLLIPATVEVSPSQAQAAEDHREMLGRLGIECSSFGRSALAVQSFPAMLPGVDVESFVRDLLDQLAEAGSATSEETLIHSALDMMACRAAVKAGDPLSLEEMQALLAERMVTDRSSNCPHGRPTTLELTRQDLERQFKRT